MSKFIAQQNLNGFSSHTYNHEYYPYSVSEEYKYFLIKTKEIFISIPGKVKKKVKISFEKGHRKNDKKKARRVCNKIRGKGYVKGDGTTDAYLYVYIVLQRYLNLNRVPGGLARLKLSTAIDFLNEISQTHNKNTLKKYRQAIQLALKSNGNLAENACITGIAAGRDPQYVPRFYTESQFKKLYENCIPEARVSLLLCYYSGLRAHEILTVLPGDQRESSNRIAYKTKFKGMKGRFYTVIGKGGLIRVVCIPFEFANMLESYRLSKPIKIVDRGIVYKGCCYAILGGAKLSAAFTRLSRKVLGFSNGLHGLRHSYAQNRFLTLLKEQLPKDIVLKTVSQELGHFRPCITKVYLRGLLRQMMKKALVMAFPRS